MIVGLALGGAIWVIGRIVYACGYYEAPDMRGPGFGITAFGIVGFDDRQRS